MKNDSVGFAAHRLINIASVLEIGSTVSRKRGELHGRTYYESLSDGNEEFCAESSVFGYEGFFSWYLPLTVSPILHLNLKYVAPPARSMADSIERIVKTYRTKMGFLCKNKVYPRMKTILFAFAFHRLTSNASVQPTLSASGTLRAFRYILVWLIAFFF